MNSIASLMPLINAELAQEPKPGIMLYSFASTQAKGIYREISDTNVDAVYIAGGPHPSAMPEEVSEFFDYVVIGEGEDTLPELIEVLSKGKDPDTVKGIAYMKDGEIRYTEQRRLVNLDLFPPFKPPLLAPIEISRGCPWRCIYCQTPRLFGRRMRHRSIEIIKQYAQFHKDVRFTSPNSFAYGSDGYKPRLEKVEALLKVLSELKKPIYFGTFPSEVRPEFVSHKALELLTKYCANKSLSIGGQSGSPTILKSIYRGHGLKHIIEACELCWEHNIIPRVDLIFGLPMESAYDERLTLDLTKWIIMKGGKVRAHYFTPLPGTSLAGMEPVALEDEVLLELGRLALNGKLTGSWHTRGRTA